MKKIFLVIGAVSVLMAGLVSCQDTTSNVGSSLVEDDVEIIVATSFTLEGQSVINDRVQSRTTTQLIGRLEAKGFGNLSSEVVTQFMPGLVLDTDNFTENEIDSVKLVMQMSKGAFTGDSLVPMGLKVYPLTHVLENPIYSDFHPSDYYDAADLWGSTVYSASAIGESDSIRALSTRNIEVMLPLDFGKRLYRQYVDNPSTFSTPSTFAQWFPGLYISNSFGRGRVTRIDKTYITMFYHVDGVSEATGNDTIYRYANTLLAVTPEIITNNDIAYDIDSRLKTRVADGQSLIVAPVGYDVEVRFPGREIVDYYRSSGSGIALVNALSMEIPVEAIDNDYGIEPPQTILMVKKSEVDNFFATNSIYDNVNSFVATYDSSTGSYTFSDMRNYILKLLEKEKITDDDVDFVLTPVNIVTETSSSYYSTSSVVTSVAPYITMPVMGRLMLDKAEIKFTFSKQSV